MIYDSFFIKGQSHDICQDYALSGEVDGLAYAMISDGCSMVSVDDQAVPHPISDFASRIVCLCTRRVLSHLSKRQGRAEASELFFELLAASLRSHQKLLELSSEMADATLSLITAKDDLAMIITIGDGVTVVERENSIDVYSRIYQPNFPAYTSYLLNLEKNEGYKQKAVALREQHKQINNQGVITLTDTKSIDNKIISAENIRIIPTHEVNSISAFSDGISDMVRGGQEHVLFEHAVKELLSIKNPCGQFVRRKLKAISRRQKTGIGPNDDLSMAMIKF